VSSSESDEERIDEEKLEILRGWGLGLGADSREEVRAAGKAITLLIAEIERLHIELWHARDAAGAAEAAAATDTSSDDGPVVETLDHTLRGRIRGAMGRANPRRAAEEP
jgi:hypothetical protein